MKIVCTAAALAACGIITAPAYANEADKPVAAAATNDTIVLPAAKPAVKPASTLEKIWKLPTIYSAPKADGLNELRIVGRFNLDAYVQDSNLGNRTDVVVRRSRIGLRAKMFHKLDINVQADLNWEGTPAPIYTRLTEANVAWKFSDAATLIVGKQAAETTHDGALSSTRILTIDRSNLYNNFGVPTRYLPGVSVGGKSGQWFYKGSIFVGGRDNGEFGDFDGGVVAIGSLGHEIGNVLGVKKAQIRVDVLHTKPNAANQFIRPFSTTGSAVLIIDDGKWGLSAEGILAQGSLGQSDGNGFMIMPWINVSKKVNLIARYTHLSSEKNNGLRFARYENAATSRRGDRYDEIYAGASYFIYGHNLKLQSGITWANMRDRPNDGGAYNGITWTTALRMYW